MQKIVKEDPTGFIWMIFFPMTLSVCRRRKYFLFNVENLECVF